METEYWHSTLTGKSWEVLLELTRSSLFKFTLIGGWAIYLWTHGMKSEDIDLVLENWSELDRLKEQYNLTKNDRLHKYEYNSGGIDVDIYIPHYSELAIPCEDIVGMCSVVSGIKTVDPEPLLMLKQAAEVDRRGTVKGGKDVLDILSLLVSGSVDFKKYGELLGKYRLEEYRQELKSLLLRSAEELSTFYKNPAEVKRKRRGWIEGLEKQ